MKKIAFLLFLAFLFACRSEHKEQKRSDTTLAISDTLEYSYDSVKVTSNNLVKPNKNQTTDTANATINYPTFKNDSLNNYIKRQVFNYFSPEENATSYQYIVDSFVKGYDSFYAENAGTSEWWFLKVDISVIRQTSNYIALRKIHSDYAGGAHGNTNISYLNFNPKTNKPITLDSLIKPTKKTELLKVAEAIFRKNENITANEPLGGKYFFEKGKFSLPTSFYVSDNGLVFLYSPYEIKAYAEGTTALVIPFADLASIGKPNTILTTTN